MAGGQGDSTSCDAGGSSKASAAICSHSRAKRHVAISAPDTPRARPRVALTSIRSCRKTHKQASTMRLSKHARALPLPTTRSWRPRELTGATTSSTLSATRRNPGLLSTWPGVSVFRVHHSTQAVKHPVLRNLFCVLHVGIVQVWQKSAYLPRALHSGSLGTL